MDNPLSDLEQTLTQKRDDLTRMREEVANRIRQEEEQLATIDRGIAGINQALATLTGKAAPTAARAPRTTRPRGEGGEGKRAMVLDLIRRHPEGLTAGQINEALEAQEKAQKQAIANALAALKSEGLIAQAQKRGPYTVADAPEEAAA